MKLTPRLFGLIVALSVGAAGAVGSGTTAGTAIKNTATASFTDPTAAVGAAAGSVTSNEVITTVLPQANFDIQYQTPGTNPDGTKGDDTATNKIPGSYKGFVIPTAAAPGNQLISVYDVVNTGNVNNYRVDLTADVTNSPATGATVKYYRDAAQTDEITSTSPLILKADDVNTTNVDEGLTKIYQVITVPPAATAGQVFAVSPKGSAPASTLATTDPAYYAAVVEPLTDLQYAQATVYTPQITVLPPAGPFTPTTVVIPPITATGTAVGNPSNPPSDPSTPTDPTDPKTTGYVDPTNPKTSIKVDTNNQIAYPTADTNATPDVVTFNNIATNASPSPDVVNLFPTGFTAFNTTTGVFTLPGGVTVRFLNPTTGNPLTVVNTGGTSFPTLTLPAGTVGTPSSTPFRTEVTYPDSNSVTDPAPIVIGVNIDSGNDAGFAADSTSTDTVMPPAAQFADANGTPPLGATDTAPEEFVVPAGSGVTTGAAALATGAAPVAQTTAATGTDASAVFPMDVANLGEYGDSFTLSGTVNIPVINAGTGVITNQTVNVRYVDAAGVALSAGAGADTFVTKVIAANDEIKVFAIVDVPAGSQAGTVLVTQNAVGNYSTIPLSDINDKVTIKAAQSVPADGSGIKIDKYQLAGTANPAGVAAEQIAITALPKAAISYAIIAKNNYNAPVASFVLSDSNIAYDATKPNAPLTNIYGTNGYANFVSALATLKSPSGTTLTGTPFYSVDGGAFTATTPTSTTTITSGIRVAFDTNATPGIDAGDTIPPLAVVRLDIKVTIK